MDRKDSEKLIIKPERPKELHGWYLYHQWDIIRKVRTGYRFLFAKTISEANIRIGVAHYKDFKGPVEEYVSQHVHEVDQIYLVLAEPGQLKYEVILEDEKFEIESPVAVYIPAGTRHAERVISGTGIMMNILKKGTYP